EALRRFDIVCDAADLAGQRCSQLRIPGRIGRGLQGVVTPPPGHPALQFDLNGDGRIDIDTGVEGDQIFADPFTTPA
ncbi:hypothetical protein D6V36_19325, partial [Vibrio cholerae]|nr:hypothetical protein [Vibrio cholerae]